MTDHPDHVGDAEIEAELRQARQRFVASFNRRCAELVQIAKASGSSGAHDEFARAMHRLCGSAGLVGFTEVGRLAGEAEQFASRTDASESALVARVEALREAFARDEVAPPSWVAEPEKPAGTALSIVVAEDDEAQRTAVTRYLSAAGHTTVGVARGDEVLSVVRQHMPDVLLLDVQLPGLDGYAICGQLRSDPALTGVTVVFVTAAVSSDERLTGLLLGADDYVEKPIDLPDLGLRVTLAARKRADPREGITLAPGELTYPDFVWRATDALERLPGVLVLLHVPVGVGARVAAWLAGDLRRNDLLGRYREDVRMLFMPGYVGPTAARHVGDLLMRLRQRGVDARAGFGVSDRPGARSLADLLKEADSRLASAADAPPVGRLQPVIADDAPRPTVLIADDDEIVRELAERPLVRAGFLCRVAVDGQHALDQVRADAPDVLVLDLSMPKLDGLQVLESLQLAEKSRPRVIVISARRQEADVRRALLLGAADYIVKPFNPLTLLARIRRLLA